MHLFEPPHSLIMLHDSEMTTSTLLGNVYHMQEVTWGLLHYGLMVSCLSVSATEL